MPWIKLTRPKRISGELHPSGTTFHFGVQACRAMVAAGDATYTDPPRDNEPTDEDQTGVEVDEVAEETSEDSDPDESGTAEDESDESAPEPVSVEAVGWQEVKGIGPSTEDELLEALAHAGVGTVRQALELDLKSLPGNAGEKHEAVRELLERELPSD